MQTRGLRVSLSTIGHRILKKKWLPHPRTKHSLELSTCLETSWPKRASKPRKGTQLGATRPLSIQTVAASHTTHRGRRNDSRYLTTMLRSLWLKSPLKPLRTSSCKKTWPPQTIQQLAAAAKVKAWPLPTTIKLKLTTIKQRRPLLTEQQQHHEN